MAEGNTEQMEIPTTGKTQLYEVLTSTEFAPRPNFLPFINNGIFFDVVSTPEQLSETFDLRFLAYSSCRFINPTLFSLQKEFEKYDCVSVHFTARDLKTAALVGCVRLILDTWKEMQIDGLLDISDYRDKYQHGLCEMSRLICYPKGQPNVSRGLRYFALKWAHENGMQKILGISLEEMADYFTKISFVPMHPYKRCLYHGRHFALQSKPLYGNIFHLDENADYIPSLV
jgi:N-acyl-L-homoserine lactone synthetase